jgi:hypothetical protein
MQLADFIFVPIFASFLFLHLSLSLIFVLYFFSLIYFFFRRQELWSLLLSAGNKLPGWALAGRPVSLKCPRVTSVVNEFPFFDTTLNTEVTKAAKMAAH